MSDRKVVPLFPEGTEELRREFARIDALYDPEVDRLAVALFGAFISQRWNEEPDYARLTTAWEGVGLDVRRDFREWGRRLKAYLELLKRCGEA